MWKSVRELPGALVTALAWIAGVAAATLPKRWWPALDAHLPVTESAALASILTVLVAAAIGVPGFVDFTTRQVSLNNRAILDAATDEASRPQSARTSSDRDWGRMFVGGSSLSLFTFIFLTPAGWISTYLGITGTWRSIAAAVDDPFGDPILTSLDALVLRSARRTRARVARQQRDSLEGPAVPDRVVRGSNIGAAGAELVIIAARRKVDWDAGTVIDTGERWYRIDGIEERTIGGWLRTLYMLSEHKDLGVFRRRVQYDMPLHLSKRAAAEPHEPAS